MGFRKQLDGHIDETLAEGILPDGDFVLEMEVPNQKPGPQHGGDEGGPKSSPAARFPWMGSDKPPKFKAPGREIPPAKFSDQNKQYPPAKFGGAATDMKEEAVAAVLADLEALQNEAE